MPRSISLVDRHHGQKEKVAALAKPRSGFLQGEPAWHRNGNVKSSEHPADVLHTGQADALLYIQTQELNGCTQFKDVGIVKNYSSVTRDA